MDELLGAVGLTALGSLLAAMAVSARFGDFLLPILLFPLVLPVLILGSQMTDLALAGLPIARFQWGVLALYDWIFGLIGYFVFDYVLED